jgi:hypothetical protein
MLSGQDDDGKKDYGTGFVVESHAFFFRHMPRMGANTYAVYHCLAHHADDQGTNCFPGIRTIAKVTNLSRPTVIAAIKHLVDLRFLTYEKRRSKTGRWQVNRYKVVLPRSTQPSQESLLGDGQPSQNRLLGPGQNSLLGPSQKSLPEQEPERENNNHLEQEPALSATDAFDRFWQSYPKKTDKKKARQAWKKLKPDAAFQTRILAAIEAQRQSSQWQDPRFIPHPSTWLNGRRWEDEVQTVSPKSTRMQFQSSDSDRYKGKE